MADPKKNYYEASHNLSRFEDCYLTDKVAHYTSLSAVYSIAESRLIRLSSLGSMNDPSEWHFGARVLEAAYAESLPHWNEQEKKHWAAMLDHEGKPHSHLQENCAVFAFSSSVIEEIDIADGELSQWRLYGDDGRGLALIIDLNRKSTRDLLQELKLFPRQVVYGKQQGKDLILSEVDAFFRKINHFRNAPRFDESEIMALLQNVVRWLPSLIKHPAYRHESEVRFIRLDVGLGSENPIKFYERNGINIPFIEIPYGKWVPFGPNTVPSGIYESIFERLIIGPSAQAEAIEDSIRYWTSSGGLNLKRSKSSIPYRIV